MAAPFVRWMILLEDAKKLVEENMSDAAVSLIFTEVNRDLKLGAFTCVDELLNYAPEDMELPLLLMIAILTATLPAKHLLKERDRYYRVVIMEGRDPERVLIGLK